MLKVILLFSCSHVTSHHEDDASHGDAGVEHGDTSAEHTIQKVGRYLKFCVPTLFSSPPFPDHYSQGLDVCYQINIPM